jgi:hypothetical protein
VPSLNGTRCEFQGKTIFPKMDEHALHTLNTHRSQIAYISHVQSLVCSMVSRCKKGSALNVQCLRLPSSPKNTLLPA